MTPPQMSGPAPAAVLGRAHANGSCQELRPTHTLGQERSFPTRSQVLSRSTCERQVSGDESEAFVGSSRQQQPKPAVSFWRVYLTL